MDNSINIIGVLVKHPELNKLELQDILTSYGCSIKTRLGLNDPEKDHYALILLELTGDINEQENLIKSIEELESVEVNRMSF